ncbi:hypothetical protein K7I13_12840 [Brucepastera parasyntrophica]|uniref:hypothetical protein n=1 Tax=Brucepastera parasyntrophica TaxID=2880008 RepID=UPI00210B5B56|nr:hypothetical protein [Brucepastera parasyntrophica]ULQ59357.1 hypothetical protein K7I13_12840 [Brucepastera parasyntrophica]
MKAKKRKIVILCSIVFIFMFAACKSTPAAVEEEPQPVEEIVVEEEVPPAIDEDLTALKEQAEALRAECIEMGVDSYRPDLWDQAEQSFNDGMDAYGTDYDVAQASFINAIGLYKQIKELAYADNLAALDAKLQTLREKALAAGANSYYPEQFAAAEDAAAEFAALLESEDTAAAAAAGNTAIMRYQILLDGIEIINLKQKIVQNGFDIYDPDTFQLAGEKYDEVFLNYGISDDVALASVGESVKLYRQVLNGGFQILSEDVIEKTNEIRALCDSIRAHRAMPDAYDTALWLYQQADSYAAAGDWESAYASYSASMVAFSELYEEVILKRNQADMAIEAARTRQEETSELAHHADEIAPLPDDAEGFSDDEDIPADPEEETVIIITIEDDPDEYSVYSGDDDQDFWAGDEYDDSEASDGDGYVESTELEDDDAFYFDDYEVEDYDDDWYQYEGADISAENTASVEE